MRCSAAQDLVHAHSLQLVSLGRRFSGFAPFNDCQFLTFTIGHDDEILDQLIERQPAPR